MKTILLVLVGMAIVIYFLTKLVRSGGRITEYFSNAVRVYLWLRDEDAKYAAIAGGRERDVPQIISFSESLVSFLVRCLVKSDARSSQASDNLINQGTVRPQSAKRR